MTTAGPVVERCPNCGAPLELDNGRCHWCGVPVQIAPASAPIKDSSLLLSEAFDSISENVFGDEADDITLLQPVSNILVFLSTTGMDPAVAGWVDAFPQKDEIAPLLASVRQAGTRIKLLAMKEKHYNEFDDHSHLHSPDEWWEIGLALDILATIGSVPGISPMTGLEAVNEASKRRNDYAHQLEGARTSAGPAQQQFQALRAAIPVG